MHARNRDEAIPGCALTGQAAGAAAAMAVAQAKGRLDKLDVAGLQQALVAQKAIIEL